MSLLGKMAHQGVYWEQKKEEETSRLAMLRESRGS